MKITELGDVIAIRKLHLQGGSSSEVAVLIGRPQRFPDSDDYYCPYRITGVGEQSIHYAGGVDAVQALEEVIRVLPAELAGLLRNHPDLRWEDAPVGDFGFRRQPIE
jgi:hypothetical protein